MRNRIGMAQRLIKKDMLDAFLVSSNLNIRYLTGFEGTTGLLIIFRDNAFLLVDSRYTLKAKREAGGVRVLTVKNYIESLSSLLYKKSSATPAAVPRVGFEEEHLNYKSFRKFTFALPGIRLCPCAGFIERQRACKDKAEIAIIKKSIGITEQALMEVSNFIMPGLSEKEIADRLEDSLRKRGARSSSFRTIVAGPETSSSPHSEPGKKKIPSRGLVMVDVGCDYHGYNSDLTRLYLLGEMNPFERKIVDIVLASQRKAINAVRAGRCAKDIDWAGRQVIERKGYGKYFGHGLGHGVGLGIHEEPSISKESNAILQEGMVITIEPGIYLPGRFGVRIEDMILVTKRGGIKLTSLPAVLKIILPR